MKLDIKNKEALDSLFGASPPRDLKLSYSRISDFYKNGPMALIRRSVIDNEGTRLGSLVDDLLHSRLVDKHHFTNIYYIYDGAKPSATLGKLINIITSTKDNIPTQEEILKIIKTNSFWSNISDETKLIKKYNTKQFWEYLKAYYNSKDKIIVGTEDYDKTEELVTILLTHEYSKDLFIKTDTKDLLSQYPIKFIYNGFILRGILDFIQIDHEKKTVQLIDLKTGKDDSEYFTSTFIKLRYDLQEAVYTLAFNTICNALGLEGYTLLPFKFLYISRYEKIPTFYEVPIKWHIAAKHGYIMNGRQIKGLYELIDEIGWHWDNKVFDRSKVLHENGGNLILKEDFIDIPDNN